MYQMRHFWYLEALRSASILLNHLPQSADALCATGMSGENRCEAPMMIENAMVGVEDRTQGFAHGFRATLPRCKGIGLKLETTGDVDEERAQPKEYRRVDRKRQSYDLGRPQASYSNGLGYGVSTSEP